MVMVTWPIFNFDAYEASAVRFFRQNISSASLVVIDYALICVVMVTWPPVLKHFAPNHIFGIGEARHFKCCMLIDKEEC